MDDKSLKSSGLDSLDPLWAMTVDIWQHGFMGVDIGKFIVALLIFAGFLLFRGLFSKYILARLHRLTRKTATQMDDRIVDALIPPIRFVPIILGLFFAVQYAGLDEKLGTFWDNTLRSLIAFTIFWAIHRALDPVSRMLKVLERTLTPTMVRWIFKVLKVLVIFMGAAVVLEVWGIQVGPLLAGLGLFGAAVALGAQEMFKNLIAGIAVIAEKKFEPGDWILVDGVVEGTVDTIGFRSTQVRRFDKAPVQVPNALLADAAITNFSRMTHRRIFWKIGVVYKTSTAQLKIVRDAIMDHITEDDSFAPAEDVPTFVRVDSFGASSIDIMVYCFTKTTDWGEWLAIKEKFALTIKEIVEDKAGTSFAFPSSSVYVEQWPHDRPEAFTPPAAPGK